MSIYLLRHTKVALPKGLCYGQSDVALSDTYAEEWMEIRHKLEGIVLNSVYSSPLSRCRSLAKHLSPSITTDERLMELNFGVWEGETWDAIYNSQEGREWFDDYFNISTPGGESYLDLVQRVQAFYSDIREVRGNTLIVTHAGVIRAFMHLLGEMTLHEAFDTPLDYGALYMYRDDVPRPTLQRI